MERATERPQVARTLQTDLQQVTHMHVTPHTARNRFHENYMKSTSEDFFHSLEPILAFVKLLAFVREQQIYQVSNYCRWKKM